MCHATELDILIQLSVLIITDGFIMDIQKISLAFYIAVQPAPNSLLSVKGTLLQEGMLHHVLFQQSFKYLVVPGFPTEHKNT